MIKKASVGVSAMDSDRDNTRRMKEYKAYKSELEKAIETTKSEQEVTWFKARLRSVKRRITDVEYEIKKDG